MRRGFCARESWYVGHVKYIIYYAQHGSIDISSNYSIAHSHSWATGCMYAVLFQQIYTH